MAERKPLINLTPEEIDGALRNPFEEAFSSLPDIPESDSLRMLRDECDKLQDDTRAKLIGLVVYTAHLLFLGIENAAYDCLLTLWSKKDEWERNGGDYKKFIGRYRWNNA